MRFRQVFSLLYVVVAVTVAAAVNPSAPFPQFRGQGGNGVDGASLPVQWDSNKGVSWSAEIPGGGWSSPVVTGDRVFVTTAVSSEVDRPKGWGEGVASMGSFFRSKPPTEPMSFEVHCLSLADGKLIWKQQIVAKKPPHKIHPSNSYATESPATDGEHVYVYFASVGAVACLDLDGETIWSRDLGAFPTANDFGTGSSLALHDGKVFVQCDNETKSFVVAFDTKTGDEVWRQDRTGRTSWSSPVIWKNRNRVELILCGSDGVTAYNPADGSTLWKLTGTGGAFSASPTSDEDRIYFGQSGRASRGPLIAVHAGAEGDLTLDSIGPQGVAWVEDSAAPGMCSPVVLNGRIYVMSRGILGCHDSKTGERVYRSRVPNASSVTASLWAAGDKIYCLNEAGETSVVKDGEQFDLLGANTIPGLYWSTPSTTGDAILLRGAAKLHCIRN